MRGVLLLALYEVDGEIVCGIREARGRIAARPKAFVEAVRSEMDRIKALAKEAGCTEVRIAGRDWSRIFPEFERVEGVRNGLRMRL